jgi:hypothetical protein
MPSLRLNKGKLGKLEERIIDKVTGLSHIEGDLTIEHQVSSTKKAVIHCKDVVADAFDQDKKTRMKATKPCTMSLVEKKDETETEEDLDGKKIASLLFKQSDTDTIEQGG